MNIRPSAAIRQNYNEIADLCRETAEPIFLTKNGEGDLSCFPWKRTGCVEARAIRSTRSLP